MIADRSCYLLPQEGRRHVTGRTAFSKGEAFRNWLDRIHEEHGQWRRVTPYIDEPGMGRLAEIAAMIDAWSYRGMTDPSIPEPKFQNDDWGLLYRALAPQGVRVPNNDLIRAAWGMIEAHTVLGEKFDWENF